MFNLILNILSSFAMILSFIAIILIHFIIIYLIPILFLYWCIPTIWEKIEDLIDNFKLWLAKRKGKKATTTSSTFKSYTEKKRAKKEWDKKHRIIATIRDIYGTIACYLWYSVPDYPHDIKLWIKTKYQRAKKGWAISDAWGFDLYLARVIKEGCAWLKKNKHGIPCGCMPNVQAIKTGNDSEDLKKAEEKWNKILDKIIKTFEIAQHIQEDHWFYQNSKKYNIKLANKSRAINKKLLKEDPDLWDKEALHVMTKQECKEYEKGWELFQEYFFNLWD